MGVGGHASVERSSARRITGFTGTHYSYGLSWSTCQNSKGNLSVATGLVLQEMLQVGYGKLLRVSK